MKIEITLKTPNKDGWGPVGANRQRTRPTDKFNSCGYDATTCA